MKNKEKYAKEIIEIACSGHAVSVSKVTGKPIACENNSCKNCVRHNDGLLCCERERLKEWAESEYIEKPVISKRDKAFLQYLGEELKYIARSKSDNLIAYQNSIEKREDGWGLIPVRLNHCKNSTSTSQWSNGKIPNRGLSRT